MKILKKTLAVLLALVLLVSSMSLTAFAAEDTDISRFSEGTGYVAFGDSFTRGYAAGYGTEGINWEEETYRADTTDRKDSRLVTGAYTLAVANAIGCNTPADFTDSSATYWPIAQNAMTTAFILDLMGIEDGFCDTEFLYTEYQENEIWEKGAIRNRYYTDLEYFGAPESVAYGGDGVYGKSGYNNIHELVNNASLITIQLGMGDIIQRSQLLALENVDMSNTEQLALAVADMLQRIYEAYDYWLGAFPLLLNYIKENNPDCTVVLISAINPLQNLIISEDILVPVGTALTAITELMNNQYTQWAKDYGFLYVNATNVECPADLRDITFSEYLSLQGGEQGAVAHPTPAGYQQIANSILYALREHEAEVQSRKTDIRIDLGRNIEPSYVIVNGNTTTNYSVKDGILTIHYGTTKATSVAVSAKGDNGKTSVTVYSLSYDNGYTAKKLYTTNDVGKVASTLASKLVSGFKAIGNLFKK